MQIEYPDIDWLKYFRSILPHEIDEMESINFELSDYFERLGMLLKETSKRTIANFMIWRFIHFHAIVMNEGFYQKPNESQDDRCFIHTKIK